MLAASGEAASLNASAPATTTGISDRASRDVPESAYAQAPE